MEEKELGLRGWLSGRTKRHAPESHENMRTSDQQRIAVLPFANMSPDPNDMYFADGITEEIISTLSDVRGLGVISRTSVMGYKNTTKKVREIGRELEVGSVLEGSFRKAGTKIRVTTQLIDVRDDRHLWAGSYDRELDDVFAVQTEIAKRVAEALRVKVLPDEEQRIRKAPTESTEAYSVYLKGKHYWNERTEVGLRKSLQYFEQAVMRDPKFALAYVGIADAYALLVSREYLAGSEGLPQVEQNLSKALEIDDELPEAHAALGNLYMEKWKWAKSEQEFRRAIELNPGFATAHHWYANLLRTLGRLDESLAEINKAHKLDPLSAIILSGMGANYYFRREYDKAIEFLKKALAMDPLYEPALGALGVVYRQAGRFDDLRELIPKWEEQYGDLPTSKGAWAWTYAWLGRVDEARRALDESKSIRGKNYVSPTDIALAHLALGEIDESFKWLEIAYSERSGLLATIMVDSLWDPLRSDPRFDQLLARMNLKQ